MSEATIHLTGALDPRSGWEATDCPVASALGLVGNRSAFLLLREAFYGTTRFDDFAHRVGVSESVAAARLKDLVDAGLLARRPYREPGARTRYEYGLTEMGREFFPVLAALMTWGDRWVRPARVELRHHDCGAPVHVELLCAAGHPVEDVDLGARGKVS
ncbi:winged helix-turn-helix transcriptional regulator [Spongisporangium articulatum]|uniref:Winged helix-turn-helix transcriptional regulator n=1 Tax=Spongisporangium articulatum TaxID=3362603 RepID=A0ABW8AQS4_9ACTN